MSYAPQRSKGLNITLTNLLWKESLNSNCQQFYQYQPNKQLPLTSNH
jgi:hypothetical protein